MKIEMKRNTSWTKCLLVAAIILFLIFGAIGCDEEEDAEALDWPTLEYDSSKVIVGSLDTPRDIVFDPSGGPGSLDEYFYISNLGDEGGVGYISRVPGESTSPSEVAWIGDLSSPAGLALTDNNQLLIADGAEVIVIDTTSGEEINRIAVDGAYQLNDIAIDNENGRFYVSDAIAGKIFTGRYWEDMTSVFRTITDYEDISALELSEEDGLLFIGCYQYILYVDLVTDSEVEEYVDLTDFDVDGLTLYEDLFIVCDSQQDLIWVVDNSGNTDPLLELNIGYSPGDVMAIEDEDDEIWYLYVPTLTGNLVNVYRIVG